MTTAGRPLRVLVVDDSDTARALLVALIEADPGLEVAGVARSGEEATEKVCRLKPDVVSMDLVLPGMDGLEATRRIMIECPVPIVICTSAADPRDLAASLEALRAGALALVERPSGPGTPSFERLSREFLGNLKAMAAVKVVRRWPERRVERRPRRIVIGIAASTGGPSALSQVLGALPVDLPASILVVQHIPAGFVEGLAVWLSGSTALAVRVARAGDRLERGVVHLAPGGGHLEVRGEDLLAIVDGPPIRGIRPSADPLFTSLARVYGQEAAAVVLTGMGEDGAEGAAAVRRAGGAVLCQDQASCVVYGMPAAVLARGVDAEVLALGAIGPRLVEHVEERASGRGGRR